ncbi:DUF2254 domain-containing protein [Falsigemmobacter faecalis]|uniref:DUF2254 domain-containing protein n=1 Tax=Falsigemmobacter faecalis TaxID=2488730 RepID=A0A3P3DKJ9_9RHOB|nr:DUF2254 domain-containing protein [Falsigemmobacter faecalis]RRH74790.1 DUF2254 domain-containing protein [Falsigemmobacter faecalis]
MTRWRWKLLQLSRRLWVRAVLLGLLGLFAALASVFAEAWLPWQFPVEISAAAVESLLAIIASSMLAVTTFSLSTMLGAFGAATNNVTPRATPLLLEDRLAQNVLSSFVGSFIFSIVGLVVLKTGAYGDRGRFILFLVTIAVIVLIVVMLLRWINHLLLLGRMGETTGRVERAATLALQARLAQPWLGGVALAPAEAVPPEGSVVLRAGDVGYLQHIDLPGLSDLAEALETQIRIPVNPGKFLYADSILAWHDGAEEKMEEFRAAFTTGIARTFDQDPRFGVMVMAEIGSRGLSPATNGAGTAIDVLGRLARLMTLWGEGTAELQAGAPEPVYPRLRVAPLRDSDLFEDAFMMMARDGAGLVEIQVRLKKTLAALSRIGAPGFRAAAERQAEIAASRAAEALTQPHDLARLRD